MWHAARRSNQVDDLELYAKELHKGMGLNSSDSSETLEMLLERIPKVRVFLNGQDAAEYVRSALKEADAIKLPRLPGLSTPLMRRVATWGLVLQRRTYPAPFWLSQRCVARELKVYRGRAATILKLLVNSRVFEIAEQQRTQYEAMRFFYRGPEPGEQEIEGPPPRA